MELGNMVFGNSRGEYRIPRATGYEEQLARLFDAYSPDRDNSWREYGVNFDNGVFSVFPYYWGDCTCGYDEAECEWDKDNEHSSTCYQIDYQKADRSWVVDMDTDKWADEVLKPIYEKHGFDTTETHWWHGCAIRCTCDYEDSWEKFLSENKHHQDCPTIKPNFLYKPTGFSISWYKYPLRDSYMNHKISVVEFSEIIDKCIDSLE